MDFFALDLLRSLIIIITSSVLTRGVNVVNKNVEFTFPQNGQPVPQPGQPQPAPQPQQVLPRQVISGTVTPSIVNNVVTCVCVPSGSCANDGNGQIDIRIVNNPSATPAPTTAPITCNYGLVRCCQNGPYRCGVRYPAVSGSSSSVAGQADYGEYPYMAAILTSGDVYIGAGALIDSMHVLTAAHKIAALTTTNYKVRLGEWDASSVNEPIPAREFNISRVFVHPNYNSNNLQNDVAVIRLGSAVDLTATPTIGTACLPLVSFAGQRCYVPGWGQNAFGPNGAYQAILKEVDVVVRNSGDCQTALTNTRLGSNFVFENASFICAGGEAGKDACTGDGGSPLVCQFSNRWFVAGLVAWGIGCAQQNVPGVYVNVASFVPYIQQVLNTP